ncbi:ribosome-associated translation inhibitor RaiA [Amphritea sp. 1_MG-2023]|uniref:ribosome hibernation-promoting factor, HPF/YfiA family n=1 Tax=Amphritea sp. 1_MG-2023 TaxID=3062670 RepID=UPI0026E37FFF|nr:ribosome-associated translation inhibitor RaiA [Amphritea sp. 1_MG-2023]MDO6564066.1 ribosome-associated translation inhibitor RaiA [Amphritea sp. 1_MG-2023]
MQINITGHHVELTDSLNEYVQNKFEKLERHFDNITNAQVTLSVEKNRQKAEGEIHVAGGKLFASDEQDVMYAAIDGLIDKLDRQVIKHKEKMKTHK